MFCPNCKAEYRPGFTLCADCHVPLVDQLPGEEEESHEPEKKFVKILETNALTDVAMLKSILDSSGINYYFLGDNMIVIYPFVLSTTLMVMEEDVEQTLELLRDVKLNYNMIFGGNP